MKGDAMPRSSAWKKRQNYDNGPATHAEFGVRYWAKNFGTEVWTTWAGSKIALVPRYPRSRHETRGN